MKTLSFKMSNLSISFTLVDQKTYLKPFIRFHNCLVVSSKKTGFCTENMQWGYEASQ